MADKGKLEIETLDAIEHEPEPAFVGSDSEKPAVKHFEIANGEPYWDTKYVIGASANRGISDQSFTSQDEVRRRPGLIKRLWLHYKRHWKLYGVLTVIGLAIGLPILFLVIFPAIAQRLVDDANLPINSASIMRPTPNSVEYSLSASLSVPAGVAVDLRPMTLSLYTKEIGHKEPYIQVDLPSYHLKGKTTLTITDQTATILDKGQFTEFLESAVNAEHFKISAYGTTAAYLGKLKANIKLNKDVDMTGMNNLSGFSFATAAVVLPPEADGTNLKGVVIMPNPSIVTFELGNVTLNMIVGGIVVGQGRINNVMLTPGNNTVPIRATLDIKTALANLPAIFASQVNALKAGNVEISASGNSTIYNGQHIDYYETVLNKLVVTGQVPIVQLLIDTAAEFLGADPSVISGLLGSLNITGIIDSLNGISGGDSSSTGSSDLFGGLLGGLTGGGNPTEMLSRLFTLGTRAMKSRTPDAEAAPTSNLAASLMGLYVKARLSKMGKEMKGRSAEPSSSPEDLLANMIGQGLNIMKERNAPAIEARKADLAPEKLLGSLTGLASGLKNAQTGQVVEKRAAPLTKARAPNEDLLASLTGLAEGLKTARTGQAVGKRTANPSPLMANPMMNLIGLGLKARMNQGQQKEQRSEEPLAERLLRGAELLKASSGMAN